MQSGTKLKQVRILTEDHFCILSVLYVYIDSLECLILVRRMTFQHSDMCGPIDKFTCLLGLLFNIYGHAKEKSCFYVTQVTPVCYKCCVLHAGRN